MAKIRHGLILLVFLMGCAPAGVAPPVPQAEEQVLNTATAIPFSTIALAGDLPAHTLTPSALPTIALASRTPYPDDDTFVIGESVEGREIRAWRFGNGAYRIVLVGAIHGGYEANATLLAQEFLDYFHENPEAILPDIQLVVIPAPNPDGLTYGSELNARFNANGVDLNRNWGCNWSDVAFVRDIPVDPGPRPFSEPETLALRSFFVAEEPAAVIFYHSIAGEVFMGFCGETYPPADWMGEVLEEATGYPYGSEGFTYEVTGDASDWLAERGIPAAVIELETRDSSEFDRNLAGVMALQCALLEQANLASDETICSP